MFSEYVGQLRLLCHFWLLLSFWLSSFVLHRADIVREYDSLKYFSLYIKTSNRYCTRALRLGQFCENFENTRKLIFNCLRAHAITHIYSFTILFTVSRRCA